jgi:hypothetical protein
MSFTVPVGPYTSVLHLAVRPEHDDGSSSMAMVDQMYLLDSHGKLCAALTGIATPTTASRQMLTVMLQSAPAGGIVVVRMVPSPNSSITAPSGDGGASSPPDSSGGLGALTPPPPPSTEFTVEIQRDDAPPTSPGDPDVSPPPFLPTGANPSTAAGAGFSHLGSASATNPTNSASNIDPGYVASATNWSNFIGGGGARVSNAPSDLDSESESESISLGPLVSRGAAPIGPALATTADDPAPSIDRDQHGGLDSDVARLADEDGEFIRRSGSSEAGAHAGRRRLASRMGDDPSPVTTLKGLGGLPSLVASFPGRRGPSQAEQLAATLQPPADLTAADQALLDATTDRRSQQDEIAKAGIATRAAGFVIALGLASGPLYPDLIAFARRRLARKRGAGSPIRRLLFRRRFPWPSA